MKKVRKLIAAALVFSSVFSVGIQCNSVVKAEAAVATSTETAQNVKSNSNIVQLYGNSSTGYIWQYSIKDENVVKVAEEKFEPDDKTGELDGSGGTYTWLFEGLKNGQTEITFNYLRPWESEVLESVTYVVTVDSDLNVVLKEKNSIDPVIGTILLYGNCSTGYDWQYTVKDTTIADIVDSTKINDDYTGLCGCGETNLWKVKGLKEGQTEIVFNYLRPWESEILDSITYVVTVDSDLNVIIKEKNASEAKMGEITLHGNLSTGYEWQYNIINEDVAEIVDEKIVSDDETGTLCGAGETHTWKVKGLKEGSTEVTFNYLRPWESEIDKNVTYIVSVDSNLNVTISEKTAESSECTAGVGTDSTNLDTTNTDSTTFDEDTTGITVHVKEIKDGNVNEYTKKISSSEIKQYFYEFSSFIDDTIKKEQEQMKKLFNFFKMNF